ncbi:uncharacterized protein LOC123544173 [Mercenaria mercenaria]|uniref:uncharacterized protein LOC123544173 n=1 Tax=Mercenaria mercenaria TaxID=6596 RepID=UPI00234F10E9|nr:uncharacterized protein LOC123544173 [Mercenaria mercenaria]
MEYCGMNSGVCNNRELFCETPCYRDSQTGSRNCSNIYQSVRGTTCLNLGGGENCANQNFGNDECVSRDSGFDFETDEQMSLDLNSDVTVFEPHPQSFLKGQGHMPCEYNGGSLVKWRMKNMKNDDAENSNHNSVRNSLHWEEFFGSSIDLTPTLLGIYDKIASANENGDQGPGDQPEVEYFVTNENLEDGSDDQCHSPKSSPHLSRKSNDQSKFRELINRPVGVKVECDDKFNNNKVKMDHEHKDPAGMDQDNKKRPLSISSMSSSSTSSLPRRRKRPNLSQYVESTSSSQLDIEKLDNLLYIDDSPETDVPERSADELSVSSEDKGKSCGDSDSQASADHSINDGDQSEHLDREKTMSLHQSDSGLSFTPANSANSSTADLSLNSDLKSVRGSPSRTSQKSSGMPRSASLKQQAHYVSFVQRVVTELVETERAYVLHLHDIKQGYYQHITDSKILKFSDRDRECLFGNIMEIY